MASDLLGVLLALLAMASTLVAIKFLICERTTSKSFPTEYMFDLACRVVPNDASV